MVKQNLWLHNRKNIRLKINYLKRIMHDYSNWNLSRQFHIGQNLAKKSIVALG